MTTPQSSQFKKTIKHSVIYAFGSIVRRLTGLVMLPIYTRYLTPSDYGAVELLGMAIELMGILVGLRISQALFRYYILAEDDKEKREIVSTILITVLFSTIIGAAVLYAFSEHLTQLLFGNTVYLLEFRLFVFTLMTNAVAAVGLSYIRALQKPVLFVSIGLFTLFLQVILNIIFVVHMEMHVLGVVYSAVISGTVVALGLGAYVFSKVGLHYSKMVLVRLIRFISPLILASLGAFYVAYADKYFIRLYAGLADVGLYALAGRMSSILGTAFEAFNMSWGADRFEVYKKENAKIIYEQVFRGMGAVFILIAAGLSLFSGDLFRVMTQPEFYLASFIVPLLTIAALVKVAMIYCNFGIILKERTRHQAEASWIKAFLATIGYVTLIPFIGVFGAALTVVLAGLVQFRWLYTRSTALYDMELQWKPIYMMLAMSCVFVGFGLLLPQGDMLYFLFRVIIYILLVSSFYILPLWSDDERKLVRMMLSKAVRIRRVI